MEPRDRGKPADEAQQPLLRTTHEAQQPLLPTTQQQDVALRVADGHHHPAPAAPPAAAAAAAAGRCRRSSVSWVTAGGFVFLTFNSAMAVYRSHGDRGTVAFVGFSYLDLLLLFGCLRMYETAEPGSTRRDMLKIAVWVLTTALTLLFSFKVAALMPPAVALVVWLMAFATAAGGFYAFFCCDSDAKH